MAGLVPAIHVFALAGNLKDVDARHKAGHDGWRFHCITAGGSRIFREVPIVSQGPARALLTPH